MNASIPFPTTLALQASIASHNSERRAWRSDPEFQRFKRKWVEREEKLKELKRHQSEAADLVSEVMAIGFEIERQRKKVRPENREFLPT